MAITLFRLLLLLLPMGCGALVGKAQEREFYTKEIGVALGSNFMLNDANSTAFGHPNVAGGALLRFVLNPRSAVKTMLTHQRISGDVSGVKDFYPDTFAQPTPRRLNHRFSGGITDLSVLYELHFMPYGYYSGYENLQRLVPFFQLGFGLTYSDAGKAFTTHFPLGIGVKYKLAPRLNLALDWTMHLTFSDRLEGLEAPKGIKSEMFRNKDHYGLTLVTLTYDISPRCPACNKAD